jgi:asparagine synthase (glutamine-hydrolysing)
MILELINGSVKEHLIADVPVGLQLSGGVDSSLVASLAAKISRGNFHSFSIGLQDSTWNEFKYSQAVAKKIRSKHHQLIFTEKQFCSLLPKLTYHLDEPMDHSHSIPMYLLSKYARKKVKILLSGEGADEIFGGYKKYRKIIPGITDREIINLTSFGDRKVLKQVTKINFRDRFPERERILKNCRGCQPFDKLSVFDQKVYLISMLVRQDKMGMAANIENRVPFLDHELVEAAFSLPLNEKIKDNETKLILKKLAEKFVPKECIYREKVGFGQPVSQWLKNPGGLGKYLRLFRNRKRNFFNYRELDKIISEHKNGICDHGQTLWILINLELWHRIFIDGADYNKIWKNL